MERERMQNRKDKKLYRNTISTKMLKKLVDYINICAYGYIFYFNSNLYIYLINYILICIYT